jgi:hypothetical protein
LQFHHQTLILLYFNKPSSRQYCVGSSQIIAQYYQLIRLGFEVLYFSSYPSWKLQNIFFAEPAARTRCQFIKIGTGF